jgi:hypothetical protein
VRADFQSLARRTTEAISIKELPKVSIALQDRSKRPSINYNSVQKVSIYFPDSGLINGLQANGREKHSSLPFDE